MTSYCLGFMFTPDLSQVLLIRKIKPEWQKNKLNGVGGKIESGESPVMAMCREFEEEVGLFTMRENWKQRLLLKFETSEVFVFKGIGSIYAYRATTVEKPVITQVGSLSSHGEVIPNLKWLIPFCLDPVMASGILVERGVFNAP